MPRRHPQPFWRAFTRCWYVQLGKRQIRLYPDRDQAFRLYHEMMARPPGVRAAQHPPSSLAAVEVIDLFLVKEIGPVLLSHLLPEFTTPEEVVRSA